MFDSTAKAAQFLFSLGLVGGVVAGVVALTHEVEPEPPQREHTMTKAAPAADFVDSADLDNFLLYPGGSQLTFVRFSTGEHVGSATERFPRPALSLIKLYLAEYVLEHGDQDERELSLEMIKGSDDAAADQLAEKYPEAISDIAKEYALWSTTSGDSWGLSQTSTYDAVKFLEAKLKEDPDSPLLLAMRESHEVASDGYAQNFGTSVLPGVKGTKWGWSNDRDLHSSISFGDDFVVAAAVMGSAEDLTALVARQVTPRLAG